MSFFNIVAQSTESTVVTEYEPVKARSSNYQSEAELEKEFIRMLISFLRLNGIDSLRILLPTRMKELLKKQEKSKRIMFRS